MKLSLDSNCRVNSQVLHTKTHMLITITIITKKKHDSISITPDYTRSYDMYTYEIIFHTSVFSSPKLSHMNSIYNEPPSRMRLSVIFFEKNVFAILRSTCERGWRWWSTHTLYCNSKEIDMYGDIIYNIQIVRPHYVKAVKNTFITLYWHHSISCIRNFLLFV